MELPAPQDSTRPEVRNAVGSIPATDSRVPELRLWGIRRSIALAVVAALLLVGGLIAAALWYAGWPGLERGATVTAATLFDLLKLVFAVVAGIGAVAALVVAYRRQRVAEHTNALAEFAHQLAHAADLRAEVTKVLAEAADERAKIETDRNVVRLFNERFAKASEQLGSEKAAVRLAGVHAMAGLADDWWEGRQTCIDVLCAYLRMPYTPPAADASNAASAQAGDQVSIVNADAARAAREEQEVRHTVIRLVGRHLRLTEEDARSWRGCDFDFTGAVFDGGDLSGATFGGGRVSFVGATFSDRVSFAGATFSGGEVSFVGVKISGGRMSFAGATFSGGEVYFIGVTFSSGQVSFAGATFSGGKVHFDGATFSGGRVYLTQVTFSGGEVSFVGATFSGGEVSFVGATFSGGEVSFVGAKFQDPPRFDDWPTGRAPYGLLLPEA
ncbi:pentapeptide repeat-containing protein [Micromonospora sp. LH3U1]|uniref:pentapeptide repeat-containing protein n=1 Tax=Micromonospora sp. LH3U1 TaxID=3018339 RepID=UPI002349FD78|nr:pentapeptide repeat-containing protein [Micromonospora sp. LH3U1]WCN80910.1 pentapeptide repeat-containing protein [Micromonospora sp. LH3U1]